MLALCTVSASCKRSVAPKGALASAHEKQAQPSTPKPGGSVEINVTPSEGISVWLDNERVAVRSPCEIVGVAPGAHLLEVRGMGYFSVSLPLSLHTGEHLKIPVALRPRPARDFNAQLAHSPKDPSAGPVSRGSDAPTAAAGQAPARVPSTEEPSAPAPMPRQAPVRSHRRGAPPEMQEVASVWLNIVPQPPAAILVDGQSVAADSVHLTRARGTLAIGRMVMTYTLLPGQVAALTVPHDRAAWFSGDNQIKAKSVVRIGRSPVALRRVAHSAQNNQEAVLRRLL